jgi:hypothetical protein
MTSDRWTALSFLLICWTLAAGTLAAYFVTERDERYPSFARWTTIATAVIAAIGATFAWVMAV